MYHFIQNPSKTNAMVATLDLKDGTPTREYLIAPDARLVTTGPVWWERWTFTFRPPPRRGLMRFRR